MVPGIHVLAGFVQSPYRQIMLLGLVGAGCLEGAGVGATTGAGWLDGALDPAVQPVVGISQTLLAVQMAPGLQQVVGPFAPVGPPQPHWLFARQLLPVEV
jgi:hypothetical protein